MIDAKSMFTPLCDKDTGLSSWSNLSRFDDEDALKKNFISLGIGWYQWSRLLGDSI